MSKQNWQLLTIDQIALTIVRTGKDALYRQQKHYYRQSNNTIMLDRLCQAEALAQTIIQEIDLAVLHLENVGSGK